MLRYKTKYLFLFQAVKQLLFNVLLFPDGGWLVDSKSSNDEPCTSEDELREHQLEKLRELCIPKVTLLLHLVMSEMNEHDGCIQLADTLASEQYQLYKVRIISKITIKNKFYKNVYINTLLFLYRYFQRKDYVRYSKRSVNLLSS